MKMDNMQYSSLKAMWLNYLTYHFKKLVHALNEGLVQ